MYKTGIVQLLFLILSVHLMLTVLITYKYIENMKIIGINGKAQLAIIRLLKWQALLVPLDG